MEVKVTVFGTTGDAGRHLVTQALQRGDAVTAVVRDAVRLPQPRADGERRAGLNVASLALALGVA